MICRVIATSAMLVLAGIVMPARAADRRAVWRWRARRRPATVPWAGGAPRVRGRVSRRQRRVGPRGPAARDEAAWTAGPRNRISDCASFPGHRSLPRV